MKTITLTVDDSKSEALLTHLRSLKDIDYIEVHNDDATAEEISMVEERWAEYVNNPSSAKSGEEVKKRIKDELGL